MKVETYEIEETDSEAGVLAADSESYELIEKLNLVGQLSLTDTKTVTRFPYRKMTKQEGLVYGVLCPVKSKIEQYSDGLIPVRVLQVAAHACDLGFCDRLEIWHPESADIKDPVLVGIKSVKGMFGHDTERWILARWGEELEDISTLAILAAKIVREKLLAKIEGIKRKVDADYLALKNGDSVPLDGDLTYYGFDR